MAGWLSESRITPAQAPYVEALLCVQDQVAFGDERMPVAKLVEAMIARQPALSLFGELVPSRIAEESGAEALMLPEEAEFYRRHFPDVSLAEIAKKR